MNSIKSYYPYAATVVAIEKILKRENLNVEKCLKIMEPELSHAFNAIRLIENKLKLKHIKSDKPHRKQNSLFTD